MFLVLTSGTTSTPATNRITRSTRLPKKNDNVIHFCSLTITDKLVSLFAIHFLFFITHKHAPFFIFSSNAKRGYLLNLFRKYPLSNAILFNWSDMLPPLTPMR